MTSKENEFEKLMLPLRALRDYDPDGDGMDLVNKYKNKNPKDDEDDEDKSLVNETTAKSTINALAAMGGAGDGVEAAPVTNAVNVDFDSKDLRGKKKRLCSWERFFSEGDEDCTTYVLSFLDGQAFAGLSLGSKVIYVKLKHKNFLISMTAKGFGVFSSNVRRGVGHGFVEGCSVACGGDGRVSMNTSCNVNAVNSITAFYTQAYPIKVKLSHLKLAMDSSVNEIALRSFVASLYKPHSQNLTNLSLEGSMVQTLGMSLLGDAMIAKKLPYLTHLNMSRNNGLYLGVMKIRKAVENGHCPELHELNISQNGAKSAVLGFFTTTFAESAPFLKRLYASNNEVDFGDKDCMDCLVKGRLSWEHFEELDLSYSVLVDTLFVKFLLGVVWNLESIKSYKEDKRPVSNMRVLRLDACEIGNATMHHLSELMMLGYLNHLEALHIGTNAVSAPGVESLLKPLRDKLMQNMTTLTMPLNTLNADGLNLMMAAQTLGVFDHLIELDVSDCGVNQDVLSLFGRAVLERDALGLLRMRKLRIFGMSPNARRQAKALFPIDFIVKCGVC
jgi:hypothetical protein